MCDLSLKHQTMLRALLMVEVPMGLQSHREPQSQPVMGPVPSVPDSGLRLGAGLPGWLSGKEYTCQCRRHRSVPKLGRSPEGGNGNPFLPGKSHGQRGLRGSSPWGHRVQHVSASKNNKNNDMLFQFHLCKIDKFGSLNIIAFNGKIFLPLNTFEYFDIVNKIVLLALSFIH